MRNRILLGTLLGLTVLAGQVLAVNLNWSGAAGTSDWFNAANWSGAKVPVAGDQARLGIVNPPNPTIWPIYDGDNTVAPYTPMTANFLIAQVQDAWFTMAGGNFSHGGNIYLGNGNGFTGNWTHNNGAFSAAGKTFNVGSAQGSTGNLTMNNGSISVAGLNVANAAGSTGNLTVNGGTINVSGSFKTSVALPVTGPPAFPASVSTFSMYGGQINCNSAEWAYHGISTILIQNATFYSDTYVSLNNAKDAKAYLTVGDNGVVDADWINFAKCEVAIQEGGLMQARGLVTTGSPVSVLSNGKIDLQGGELKIHHTDPSSYQSFIDQWISENRIYTTLPGQYVTYSYDYETEYFTLLAVPEPASLGLLMLGAAMLLKRRR